MVNCHQINVFKGFNEKSWISARFHFGHLYYGLSTGRLTAANAQSAADHSTTPTPSQECGIWWTIEDDEADNQEDGDDDDDCEDEDGLMMSPQECRVAWVAWGRGRKFINNLRLVLVYSTLVLYSYFYTLLSHVTTHFIQNAVPQ